MHTNWILGSDRSGQGAYKQRKVISNENDKAAIRGNLPTDTNCGGLHEMMLPGNLAWWRGSSARAGKSPRLCRRRLGPISPSSRRAGSTPRPRRSRSLRITGSPGAVEMARFRVEAILASEMEKVGCSGGSVTGFRCGWATINNYNFMLAQSVCFEAGVQG